MPKTNPNIVSLRRDEKAATVRALLNQVSLLRGAAEEEDTSDAIREITLAQVEVLEAVIGKLS